MSPEPEQIKMTAEQIHSLWSVGLGALAGIIGGIGGSWMSGRYSFKTMNLKLEHAKEKDKKKHDLDLIRTAIEKVRSSCSATNKVATTTDVETIKKEANEFLKLRDEVISISYVINDDHLSELIEKHFGAGAKFFTTFIETSSPDKDKTTAIGKLNDQKEATLRRLSELYREILHKK